MSSAYEASKEYAAFGIPTLPLRKRGKRPLYSFDTPAAEQWRQALQRADHRALNIGVLVGDGLAYAEADTPEGVERLLAWREGLGLSGPIIRSPRGGLHAYMRLADKPEQASYNLSADFGGGGVLRVDRGIGVAPWSEVDARAYHAGQVAKDFRGVYRFEHSAIEDFSLLKPVAWADVRPLLAERAVRTQRSAPALSGESVAELPVRLLYRPYGKDVKQLFAAINAAGKGSSVTLGESIYRSRSEAEFSAVLRMILSGWSFEQIAAEFERIGSAAYMEHEPDDRERYLRRTHERALREIVHEPERKRFELLYQDVLQRPALGRTGALNRRVLLAIASRAWQFKSPDVEISQREIAEHAASSQPSASRAINRLVACGELQRKQPSRADAEAAPSADVYRLPWSELVQTDITKTQQVGSGAQRQRSGKHRPAGGVVEDMSLYDISLHHSSAGDISAELFGYAALGRSAELVLQHAPDGEPVSLAELAEATGKSRWTCKRALEKLAFYGIAEPVSRGVWTVRKRYLAEVAEQMAKELRDRRGRRVDRHARDRGAFESMLKERRSRQGGEQSEPSRGARSGVDHHE